jgi:hypothetical protein
MKLALLALSFAIVCAAEVVDRVAANIGLQVITATQVEQEARITAFDEGVPPDLSPANQRKVLDRLIDQFLIRKELEFTHFAPVAESEVEPVLKQIRDRYRTEKEFNQALADYGITADELKNHVTWTVTVLRFIEYRFQPAVQISPTAIRQEYRRQAAEWQRKNKTPPPPLEQIQPEIEKIIRQRLVDASLDRWLGEVRTQTNIAYHDGFKL